RPSSTRGLPFCPRYFLTMRRLCSTPGQEKKGWDVQHDANRVYITPVPVTQTEEVTGSDGNITRIERVYEPSPENWTTNLFVVTTKRYYSMELRVNEPGKSAGQQAYVVNYSYPQEDRKKAEK
ncbi:putative TriH conjugal transfer protein, partial [Serratia symbiotica str. Tucson]